MRQKLLNYAMVILLAATSIISAEAQKTMDVSKFTKMSHDLMARVTKPIRDKDEGKLCALIRVVTPLSDLEIRADALGIVQKEKHAGEIWLYVPYGARSLSFAHDGYFPLLYQYTLPIEEATVYELYLNSYDTNTDAMARNSNTQLFVLTHNPDEAKVFIDDMEMPSENGVFASMMSKGDHSYKVTADSYEEAEGTFTLADQPFRETVTLHPLFGTFFIRTQPKDGFDVSINGKNVGETPYKSERLEPGSYNIHITKEGYVEKDTLIRLREGDNLNLTLESEEWYVYNNLLGGHSMSFGIQVGYVLPFVSSSSGGSFTGSPINYSLGDSRENVSYTSQSGFKVGAFVDIRLYKNLYLVSGLNFTHIKYSNKFEEPMNNYIYWTLNDLVYRGDMTNRYKEDYTINMIEIPILASYRFVLSKKGSLHLNLGPYVSYGLSSKMKLSGSSECQGNIYSKMGTIVDYNISYGSFTGSDHTNGDFDLFSKEMSYTKTSEAGTSGIGSTIRSDYSFSKSPYSKLNYGLKLGAIYEIHGFQFGVEYNLQLSNMGNKDFWESTRIPIFNNQVGSNKMSGYKHRINYLEIKLGYVFRY